MEAWAAGVRFDEGRLGHISCFGLKSRAAAIEWLNSLQHDLHMLPSCWIEQRR